MFINEFLTSWVLITLGIFCVYSNYENNKKLNEISENINKKEIEMTKLIKKTKKDIDYANNLIKNNDDYFENLIDGVLTDNSE